MRDVTQEARRRALLGDFLRSRRERLRPDQVGLPPGHHRRVKGLRREEVAHLADVSLEWYTWLEQGRDIQPSRSVLQSIAHALQLTDDERTHLAALTNYTALVETALVDNDVPSSYALVLDALGETPAYITNWRADIVAWNDAAERIFFDFASLPPSQRNLLWLLFANPSFRVRFPHSEAFAQETVQAVRVGLAAHPTNVEALALIDDLLAQSVAFQQEWGRHDVRVACAAQRTIDHPEVGQLVLQITSFQMSGNADLRCCIYTAVPGSPSHGKLVTLLQRP